MEEGDLGKSVGLVKKRGLSTSTCLFGTPTYQVHALFIMYEILRTKNIETDVPTICEFGDSVSYLHY